MKERHVHPWAFMVLIAPFGVMSGYTSVAIGYYLKQAGVSVAQVASIVALGLLPHTVKLLWAPLVDATLSQKRWYMIGGITSAVGLALMGAMPATKSGLAILGVVVFLASAATSFIGMATESLMAWSTPEELKGRAGGWFQAGNLGGNGVGGGIGLWLTQHLSAAWMASTIVGVLCMLCCLALLMVPTPGRSHGRAGFGASLLVALKDLWSVVKEKSGLLALILCFLPIGAGAASGLWSAVADEWHASANTVALVTGILNGVVSAVGCVVGGWICDRMDRKMSYIAYGVLQAAGAVLMAVCPRTEANFIFWTLFYAFVTGLTYAGFTAVVLEAIGKGAAATKYSVYASLSNVPIAYMTTLDGWAHDHWNSSSMLFTESAIGVGTAILFALLAAVMTRGRWTTRAVPEAAGAGE